jgi:hypothetical protein
MKAQKYRIGWTTQPALAPPVNRALGQQLSNVDECLETLFTELRHIGSGATAPTGSAGLTVREIPTGVIDGSNLTFTLAHIPIADSEQVFLNGLLQEARGIDYSISGASVTFLMPPLAGDRVLVTYQRT